MVIKSNPGLPALDMESVLLLEKGAKTLDKVFDVIGHLYMVRFNSEPPRLSTPYLCSWSS